MSGERKRVRTANFSLDEKKFVLELVAKYKHIVENKKTDGVTKQQKDIAWEKITNEFNSMCLSMTKRTAENLRNFFDNQKRIARKKAASQKFEQRKTGGGSDEEGDDDPLMDMTLSIINKKSVYGLPSRFDDDASVDLETEVFETTNLLSSPEDLVQQQLSIPGSSSSGTSTESEPNVGYEGIQPAVSWSAVETTISPNIDNQASCSKNKENCNKGKTQIQRAGAKKWASRRRPATNVSANLSKLYEDLASAKKELTEVQLSLLRAQKSREEQEVAEKREREAEKFQLEKEVLLSAIQKNKEEALYWRKRRETELGN